MKRWVADVAHVELVLRVVILPPLSLVVSASIPRKNMRMIEWKDLKTKLWSQVERVCKNVDSKE